MIEHKEKLIKLFCGDEMDITAMAELKVDDILKEIEANIRKDVVKEIRKGIEEYKIPKELVRVNKLKADYIYVYDLNTFVLEKLIKE